MTIAHVPNGYRRAGGRARATAAGHVSSRRSKMGDTREAGRPRMSPQWEMVMARFDDVSRGLARLETRIDQNDRETRTDMQDLRDQIQRTRDEVAQASLTQERVRSDGTAAVMEKIEGLGERVESLEVTRRPDVEAAVAHAAPRAGVVAGKKAAQAAWSDLPWPGKVTAAAGALGVIGTMIAGFVDGLPKVADGIMKVIEGIASAAN